jgi:hypothetical protein
LKELDANQLGAIDPEKIIAGEQSNFQKEKPDKKS